MNLADLTTGLRTNRTRRSVRAGGPRVHPFLAEVRA
jgi:hypothetical protein